MRRFPKKVTRNIANISKCNRIKGKKLPSFKKFIYLCGPLGLKDNENKVETEG